MASPCLGFKSLNALSFYETVEIGTLGAVGGCVIGLLFRLLFTFSRFFTEFFWGNSVEGLRVLSQRTFRRVKKCALRWNNENLLG